MGGTALALVLLQVACGESKSEAGQGTGSGGVASIDDGDESAASGSATTTMVTSGGSEGAADETSGVKFDLAMPEDIPDDEGCSKVDFLFVIDNSVSMADQQEALTASFPGFIEAIETTLEVGQDFHVMVVDTDAHTRCSPANCADPAGADVSEVEELCVQPAAGYACNQANFGPCDSTMGAGVVHPAGDGASNQPCNFASGRRYMDATEPDLGSAFACAGRVGLAGWPRETPMDALVAALSPEINAPGGCNEGFLRDDAILVVTFISDDPHYVDSGMPMDWYQAAVDAKGGDPAAIVVLGLIPAFEGCGPANRPDKGRHWADFVALFGARGATASVCNLDYASFFAQSVSLIDETCDSFVPG